MYVYWGEYEREQDKIKLCAMEFYYINKIESSIMYKCDHFAKIQYAYLHLKCFVFFNTLPA